MRYMTIIALLPLLGACAQAQYTTERGGEIAGRGVAEYCTALPAVRMTLRENFNRGLNRTAPGASIHINCPAHTQEEATTD